MRIGVGIGMQYGGGLSPFLPETIEFISRASVTDAAAKEDINQFIIGCKQLGIWDQLIYVPCLSAYGGRNQLGGATQRNNTPWALVNATDTALGVRVTRNGDNNYLLSEQTYDTTTPFTSGSISYQDVTPNFVEQVNFTQKLVGQTWSFAGMANAGNPRLWCTQWVSGLLASPASTPALGEPVCNTYRNAHLSAVNFDGTANYAALTDNNITTYTHTGPIIGSGVNKIRFYPPTSNLNQGVIQGCFLYYGNLSTLGNAVWSKFRALVNQTILSRLTSAGNRRILISGQSNGVNGNLSVEFSRQSVGEAMGPTELFRSGFGGQNISYRVGVAGSNERTVNYRLSIWDTNSLGPLFQSSRIDVGRRTEYFIWFQGESDTQSAEMANAYRAQLATLINYFRADTGNPDLKVIVVQVDYNFTLRDDNAGGFFSDLTLTGFTGGLTALNGSYAITTLTSNSDPYVWTKSGYRVEEQSNRWVFVETAGSTVVASAVQTHLPHPAMATNWVDAASNPITPSFGAGNRTEWIERVRYAQREICNDLPNVYTFDSRGYTRTDGVHIDNAAHIPFATALGDYLLTI